MKNPLFLLLFFIVLSSITYAQIDEQQFTDSGRFGNDVAVSGNWAVVGNVMDNIAANGRVYDAAGSASIFRKQPNGIWVLHAKISETCWYSSGDQSGNYFGHAVSIDDEWAVIGADYDSDGQGDMGPDGIVFVYRYSNALNAWVLHQQLSGPIHSFHFFGYDVSVKGDLLAISDPFCTTNNEGGRVYTYRFDQESDLWVAETSLVVSGGHSSHYFGHSISVSDNRILVGAPKMNPSERGGVYLFEFDEGIYSASHFTQPSPADLDQFGFATDLHEDFFIAGSPGTIGSSNNAGKAFVFQRNSSTGQWGILRTLIPTDIDESDAFGYAVAMGKQDGEILFAATSPQWDGSANTENSRGAAYLFRFDSGTQLWDDSQLLSADGAADHGYGSAVGIDRNIASQSMAVTAISVETSPQGITYGAAYMYSLLPSSSGIWTGAEDDIWSNPANWSDGIVPNGATDITIATGSVRFPVVDDVVFCRNLTIESGAWVKLVDAFSIMNIGGDLLVEGSFLYSDEATRFEPQLFVQGDATFYCDTDKWLPGGVYSNKVNVNASNLSNKLSLLGDVSILGQLYFQHTTRGQLHIGDRTLVLYDLVGGLNPNALYSNEFSNLVLTGNPPIACYLSRNISEINNLTIDNDEGVQWISSNMLYVYGVLTLLNGTFNVVGNNGNNAFLTLYNSVEGNSALLKSTVGQSIASITIKGNEQNYQLPEGLTSLRSLLVLNPNVINLNSNIHINSYLFLAGGQLKTNGYVVSYGPSGQFWSSGNTELSQGMIDPDNPPAKIWVQSNQLLLNADADVADLQIDAISEGLKLAASRKLTVGATSNVKQKLFLASSSEGSASFIDNSPTKSSLAAEVEQYLDSGRWHLVAAPVDGAKASAFYFQGASPSWLKYYDEPTDNWMYIQSLEEDLLQGKGYAVWVDSDKSGETAVFDGLLCRDDIAINLSYSGPQKGWNLVGNPFSSALDWDEEGWNLQNTTGIVYVWNNGNYLTRNLIGQGTLLDGIIPIGQSFFVQAASANASMILPISARVHHADGIYKDAKQEFIDVVEITAIQHGKVDKTWLGFDESGTSGIDLGLDAIRLSGASDMPEIFTKCGDNELSINMMSPIIDEVSVPLYFSSPTAGETQLVFQYLDSFNQMSIILKDLLTGNQVDLSTNLSFTFDASPDDPEHRFMLVFNRNPSAIYSFDYQNDYQLYNSNGVLQIISKHGANDKTIVSVFDVNGRLFYEETGVFSGQLTINSSTWPTGLFMVSIRNGMKVQHYKIINQ